MNGWYFAIVFWAVVFWVIGGDINRRQRKHRAADARWNAGLASARRREELEYLRKRRYNHALTLMVNSEQTLIGKWAKAWIRKIDDRIQELEKEQQ